MEREEREGREEGEEATLTLNLRLAILSLHLEGGGISRESHERRVTYNLLHTPPYL